MTDQTVTGPEIDDQTTTEQSDESKKAGPRAGKDEITEENCKFTEGQILKFVRVRFPGHAKSYPFLVGKRSLMYGQKVVAMSDRGMAVGYINSFTYEVEFTKSMLPIRSINKVATEIDFEREKETYKRQKDAETLCQDLIEKHNLEMNLTHVEFTQFGKKVVFYFVAPNRVDFRGLVKDLVGDLKLRIELRQISLRDRAASMGAIGPCGRELCCSSFLSRYGNVSIKMAKNQNLTLNYSKLNGVCGQLKCCLQYEEEVYDHKRNKLPTEGTIVETYNGDVGYVRKIHILTEQFDLMTTTGNIRRYTADQYKGESTQRMPESFDSILDETNTIIGLGELEAKNAAEFESEMEMIKVRSRVFAREIFSEYTGIAPEDQVAQTPEETETKPTPQLQSAVESPPNEALTHEKETLQSNQQSNERQTGNNKRHRRSGGHRHHRGRRKPNRGGSGGSTKD